MFWFFFFFCKDVDGKSTEDLELDLSILDEVLRMLLEILNAAFTHQLTSNQNLIYSILHQREVLDVLRRQAPFQDVVTNLDLVKYPFQNMLTSVDSKVNHWNWSITIQVNIQLSPRNIQ